VADHASAKKRNRQTIKLTERNRAVRTAVRSSMKRARAAIESGNKAEATMVLAEATRKVDMAVSKGVFHRKTGSRYISRLSAQVAGL
jgi:small subunit ribosomal protein S20